MTQKKVTATGVQQGRSATSAQQLYDLLRGTTSSIGFPYPYAEQVDYLLRQNGDYILLQTGDKIVLNG